MASWATARRPTAPWPSECPACQGSWPSPAGGHHSLALKSDGTVWAWGWNGYGQLGDNTRDSRYAPVPALGVRGVQSIASGYYHSVVVIHNGLVAAWGLNAYGQLGDGSTTDRQLAKFNDVSGARAVAGGAFHTLVITSSGSVSAWGWNGFGQLGDGTSTDRLRRVSVTGPSTARIVAAGAFHSLSA